MDDPLSPHSNDTHANYTQWIKSGSVRNYTSYVYIDEHIWPKDHENGSIIIDLELTVSEGIVNDEYGSSYSVYVHEAIPEGVTGWIPVTVQYGS